ncbi:hypothetical protein TRFO_06306 [Tritrichomonas foetus]|uniref:Uncharacterized protein n=1 Tax=Tritrichomonas foetus TaxID=1144522 RepID=A0A1J4JZ22_9EUKA|nr:hypothetical protein TRFO_06306 [Tritrichomonas foetus]|eukprot:OHT04423.1 hypothetical protein TRFO_06306 [Tritrichomonas foetus]
MEASNPIARSATRNSCLSIEPLLSESKISKASRISSCWSCVSWVLGLVGVLARGDLRVDIIEVNKRLTVISFLRNCLTAQIMIKCIVLYFTFSLKFVISLH